MNENRVKLALLCRDCDYIPKIKNAGFIFYDNKLKIEYQLMHNGVKVLSGGYHGKWMTNIIKGLRGHHESQEEKVFYEVLKHIHEESVMIEVGSFWAYYSCWFNKMIKGSKNYMIEPNLEKLKIGEINFKLNNISGDFTQGFVGKNSTPLGNFIDSDGTKKIVPKICIDSFIKEKGIEHINILHADIQGDELDMLYGCKECIKNSKIDYIFLSTHDNKHDKCLKYLLDNKFKIISEHSIPESFSGDGLIVVCAPHIEGIKKVHITKNYHSSDQFKTKYLMVKMIKYFFIKIKKIINFLLRSFKKREKYIENLEKMKAYDLFSRMSNAGNIKEIIFNNGDACIKLKDDRVYLYNPNIKVMQLYSIPAKGVFEEKETEYVKKVIKPGQVCFDIGGSFGWYTILLSKLVGENGQVYVFEPVPENYDALLKNIEINLCKNVLPNKLAIGEKNGKRELFIPDVGVSGSFALHNYDKRFDVVNSDITSIDYYCEKNKVSKINFIKADIEGAELLMLKGCVNTIKRFAPIFFLEVQEKSTNLFGYKPKEIFDFLFSLGYESYYVSDKAKLIKFNDYLLSKLPDNNFIFLPSK